MKASKLIYGTAQRMSGATMRYEQRFLSAQQQNAGNKNFFKNLINNVQDELKRNKELQESKKALEERLKMLNNSEARKKFDKIEKDTSESTAALVQRLGEVTTHVNRMMSNIQSSDAAKEAIRQAKIAAEVLEKAAKTVGDTQVYKQVSSTANAVRVEVDNLADVRMYSRPEELKMRTSTHAANFVKTMDPDTETTGIQLHKDSKWYSNWSAFSESNAYYNKILDWKIRFDESENPAVRLLRGVTDRVLNMLTAKSEVSEVLTEIAKIDSKFDKVEWLRFCEKEIVPNILEAYIRGDLEVLQDWCYERAFKMLSTLIKDHQKIGFSMRDSQIIDMVSGKMMDQGPVLVITFQVFMIQVVKNSEGKVIEGDPNKPTRVHHVWVMCRDMEEFNPSQAWKLLELHTQASNLAI